MGYTTLISKQFAIITYFRILKISCCNTISNEKIKQMHFIFQNQNRKGFLGISVLAHNNNIDLSNHVTLLP